jgi:ssDNA-binding Zn-finger/Zn-ribbon topoisomerase 1
MKPTRNRYLCPDCGRVKMLFESREKAQRFIDWNAPDICHGDHLRPYYCPACCGWHISHLEYKYEYEGRTERMINEYRRIKVKAKNCAQNLIKRYG